MLSYQFKAIRLPDVNEVGLNLSYNFYDYFQNIQNNRYQKLQKQTNRLEISVPLKVDGWVDYGQIVMLYAKRRGDTIITNNKENLKLSL